MEPVQILGVILVVLGILMLARSFGAESNVAVPGVSIKAPASVTVLVLGVLVYLFPYSPWWPEALQNSSASRPVSSGPSEVPAETRPDIAGRYALDPGSDRIIVLSASGRDSYSIEALPPVWPFRGDVRWVGGQRYEGEAESTVSKSTFHLFLERMVDGTLKTTIRHLTDTDGNPITRDDPHTLVPVS